MVLRSQDWTGWPELSRGLGLSEPSPIHSRVSRRPITPRSRRQSCAVWLKNWKYQVYCILFGSRYLLAPVPCLTSESCCDKSTPVASSPSLPPPPHLPTTVLQNRPCSRPWVPTCHSPSAYRLFLACWRHERGFPLPAQAHERQQTTTLPLGLQAEHRRLRGRL